MGHFCLAQKNITKGGKDNAFEQVVMVYWWLLIRLVYFFLLWMESIWPYGEMTQLLCNLDLQYSHSSTSYPSV